MNNCKNGSLFQTHIINDSFKSVRGLKPSVGAPNSRVFPCIQSSMALCFTSSKRPKVNKLSVFGTALSDANG